MTAHKDRYDNCLEQPKKGDEIGYFIPVLSSWFSSSEELQHGVVTKVPKDEPFIYVKFPDGAQEVTLAAADVALFFRPQSSQKPDRLDHQFNSRVSQTNSRPIALG